MTGMTPPDPITFLYRRVIPDDDALLPQFERELRRAFRSSGERVGRDLRRQVRQALLDIEPAARRARYNEVVWKLSEEAEKKWRQAQSMRRRPREPGEDG